MMPGIIALFLVNDTLHHPLWAKKIIDLTL